MTRLSPELLLRAYCMGVFPMAQGRASGEILWYDPERRGVLPIAGLHVPRRLARTVRQNPFHITFDRDFRGVITACAEARADTWINGEIIEAYAELHRLGFAHSVEAWEGDVLAGGVYGIAIGAAFFGESMFSCRRDASKIALVFLAARLWRQGYALLDTQFVNAHLKQFGVMEIPRDEYRAHLAAALSKDACFGISQSSGAASAPSSKEPGSCSMGGMGEGLGAGTGASASAPVSGLSGAASVSSAAAGSSCALTGVSSGAFSEENSSEGFADTLAFLHSITQTS